MTGLVLEIETEQRGISFKIEKKFYRALAGT